MNHKRLLALSITAVMALAACQQPTPTPVVPGPGPVVPGPTTPVGQAGPIVTANVGDVSLETGKAGVATVAVTANAQNGANLKSIRILLDGVEVSKKDYAANTSGDTSNYNVPIVAAATAKSYTVTVEVTDSNGKVSTVADSFELTRTAAPVAPGGGGTVPGVTPPTPPTDVNSVLSDDINLTTQYRFFAVDQTLPSNTTKTRIVYVRGTFPLDAAFTTVGTSAGPGLPSSSAGVEYFLSNTTTNASNKISSPFNTTGLNQGELYTIIARVGLQEVGRLLFVPDNLAPQVPYIIDGKLVSQLPSKTLTNLYGNWVNKPFNLSLDNSRTLEDNPNNPSSTGQQNPGFVALPGIGVRDVRYYALPVDSSYVGDPAGSSNDLTKAIFLGKASSNNTGPNNSQNSFNLDGIDPKAKLPDGRYVVFGLAYDYLGNRNPSQLNGQNSFILNVDTVGPTAVLGIVDRGPLDVYATGPNCDRRDVVATPLLAPTDVYYAEPGFASGCIVISGTINDIGVGFGAPGSNGPGIDGPSGIASGSLLFDVTNPNNGVLTGRVVNVNNLSGPQVFSIANLTDLLGNPSTAGAKATIVVDNDAPIVNNLSVTSANSTNRYLAWQQLGLQTNAVDDNSGLRTNVNERYGFYYGTDVQENLAFVPNRPLNRPLAFDYALVQIDPNRDSNGNTQGGNTLNFNVPNPLQTAVVPEAPTVVVAEAGTVGKLNLWGTAADKAGNASALSTSIEVIARTPSSPVFRADIANASPATNETSQLTYQGFNTLNRTPNGNVDDTNTPDQLKFGPLSLNTTRNQYGFLPSIPGAKGTKAYELTVPVKDIAFNGNSDFQLGAGLVNFIYRAADPQALQYVNPGNTAQVPNVSPYTAPASYQAVPFRRWLYNLPEFSSKKRNVETQIDHIWGSIAAQGAQGADVTLRGQFNSVVGDSAALIHNGIGVLAFNNYGNVALQTKGNTARVRLQDVAPNLAFVQGDNRKLAVDGSNATFFTTTDPQGGTVSKTLALPLSATGAATTEVRRVRFTTPTGLAAGESFVVLLSNGTAVTTSLVEGKQEANFLVPADAAGPAVPLTSSVRIRRIAADGTFSDFSVNEVQIDVPVP